MLSGVQGHVAVFVTFVLCALQPFLGGKSGVGLELGVEIRFSGAGGG